MAGDLTARQQRFVQEYLVDLNATQAAIRAGYSPKYAGQNADKLLKNTNIAAEIAARQAVLAQKLEVTQERVLQELAAIGFANITDFVQVETQPAEKLAIHPITGEVVMVPAGWCQSVRVVDTAELPPQKIAAVASIRQTAHGTVIKLHDKIRALELLGKHLGLFDGNAAAVPTGLTNLFDAIVGNAATDIEDLTPLAELLEIDDIPESE